METMRGRILPNVVSATLLLSATALAAGDGPRPARNARPNTTQTARPNRPRTMAAPPSAPHAEPSAPAHAPARVRLVAAPARTIPERAYSPLPEANGDVHVEVAHMTKVFEGAYKDFAASPEGDRLVPSLRLGLAYAKLFEASVPGGAQSKQFEKNPRAALAARVSNHLIERTRLLKIVREEPYGPTREKARLEVNKLSDVLIADAMELGEAVGERHIVGPHLKHGLEKLRDKLDDAVDHVGHGFGPNHAVDVNEP